MFRFAICEHVYILVSNVGKDVPVHVGGVAWNFGSFAKRLVDLLKKGKVFRRIIVGKSLLGAFYEVNCISLYTRIGNCAIDI